MEELPKLVIFNQFLRDVSGRDPYILSMRQRSPVVISSKSIVANWILSDIIAFNRILIDSKFAVTAAVLYG